jgi:hypothetical protein
MNKAEIINIIGQESYRDACEYARQNIQRTSPELSHQIRELIWDSDASWSKKLELFFDIYDDMPTYGYVMDVAMNYHEFSSTDKKMWWSMARDRLASGDYATEQPVAYSLWCDFFEDPNTVEESWAEVSNETVPESVLRIALLQSGPVPYQLKRQVYDRLLPNSDWHNLIFHSLTCSAFDAYGQIDSHDASKLLSQLVITPPYTEYIEKFTEKIGCSIPIKQEHN